MVSDLLAFRYIRNKFPAKGNRIFFVIGGGGGNRTHVQRGNPDLSTSVVLLNFFSDQNKDKIQKRSAVKCSS